MSAPTPPTDKGGIDIPPRPVPGLKLPNPPIPLPMPTDGGSAPERFYFSVFSFRPTGASSTLHTSPWRPSTSKPTNDPADPMLPRRAGPEPGVDARIDDEGKLQFYVPPGSAVPENVVNDTTAEFVAGSSTTVTATTTTTTINPVSTVTKQTVLGQDQEPVLDSKGSPLAKGLFWSGVGISGALVAALVAFLSLKVIRWVLRRRNWNDWRSSRAVQTAKTNSRRREHGDHGAEGGSRLGEIIFENATPEPASTHNYANAVSAENPFADTAPLRSESGAGPALFLTTRRAGGLSSSQTGEQRGIGMDVTDIPLDEKCDDGKGGYWQSSGQEEEAMRVRERSMV